MPLQDVAEIADILADALIAPIAVKHEVSRRRHEIAVHPDDPDVADDARQTRLRGFRVAVGVHDADDALPDALAVVGDYEQRPAVAAVEVVVGRHVVAGVVGEQLLPLGQAPVVDELGFLKQEVLDLGAGDGDIGRREFFEGAQKFAVGGLTAAGLFEALRPNYAWAQQVAKDDKRIKGEYVTVPSPAGNGSIKGYLATPANASGKLPGVLVIHENRGLNPYIEDVARRLALLNFVAFAPDALFPVGGYPGDEDKGRDLFAKQDTKKRIEDLSTAVSVLKSLPEFTSRNYIDELAAIVAGALAWADVLVTTGGLGPTADDVTREALAAAGIGTGDLAHIDLYSCFPAAVQLGAQSLGLPLDRQLTRTGGLPFSGGPWNNYVMHSIATVVSELRERAGQKGLVWANGGYATKHAFGVYSTTPPADGRFKYAYPQDEIDAMPRRELADGADGAGTVTIEAYSVMHDRDGNPETGLAACLTADGRRTWARSAHRDLAVAMCEGEWVGRKVRRDAEAAFDAV